MKKKYSKPYILFEEIQLDASIAASCSSYANGLTYLQVNAPETECTAEGGYFASGNCNTIVTQDPDIPGGWGVDTLPNDGECYHGPVGTLVFIYS